MSAKAGLVIKIPMLMLTIVVNANPFRRPAPVQNRGIMATTIVEKAAKITNKALLILSLMLLWPRLVDSARIIIWSLTPVPIPAIIPAMLGASRFQPIRAATPRVMKASENIVRITDRVILIFLYLMNMIKETIAKTINPKRRIFFVN